MAEEIMNQETKTPEYQEYIDTIAELKRTTVSREDYDKLQAEKKQLLSSIVNGQANENAATAATTKPTLAELRDRAVECIKKGANNIDTWTAVMEHREALLEAGFPDPCLPFGRKIKPTAEDVEKNNNVFAVVRECIEYADGDNDIFTNEMQRRTNDYFVPKKRK